jgi:transmembrane sensor
MEEKDYKAYDPEQLALDAGFIRWVRGDDAAATRFWERWQSEHPERAETLAAARRLVRAMSFEEEAPSAERIDRLWERIATATAESGARRGARLRRLLWPAYVAAACVLFLLVVRQWRHSAWEELRAMPGEQLAYVLPDSSEVRLNAGATLRYDARRWKRERRLTLSGEAFFSVRPGAPFSVVAGEGLVRVLGTTFNVLARGETLVVDCFSGRVEVRLDRFGASAILDPGQGARRLADGRLETYRFDENRQAAWRRGVIYYESEPLGNVFDELERQFDVSVTAAPELRRRSATGFFQLNNLDSALYEVCWPMNLAFRRDGRTVIIE